MRAAGPPVQVGEPICPPGVTGAGAIARRAGPYKGHMRPCATGGTTASLGDATISGSTTTRNSSGKTRTVTTSATPVPITGRVTVGVASLETTTPNV